MPGPRSRTALLAALVAALAVATGVAFLAGGDDPPRAPASAAPPAAPAVALDGGSLFAAKGCAVCHVGPEHPDGFPIGPDLSRVAAVAGTRVPGLDAEAYLRQSIAAPAAFVAPLPGRRGGTYAPMPAIPVSAEELDALVAYLLADQAR